MTIEEVQNAIAACADVTEEQVAGLLTSAEPAVRQLAHGALARTGIRKALEYCASLAREQSYGDQPTLTAIQRLVGISDIDEPYIETLKQLGIQAAHGGKCNHALQYLQEAVSRAFAAGQRKDARSRKAIRFLHDREIAEGIERAASYFRSPVMQISTSGMRMAILCSAVQDEDGPSVITLKRSEYFRDLGWDVEVLSTELASSSGSRMSGKLQALGVPLTCIPPGPPMDRMHWLIDRFTRQPVDAVCYMASTVDQFAIAAACVGLAPVQSWDTRALEPQTGKFDLVIQGVSAEQETKTRWPGRSKFVGLSVAMADEIDAAEPFKRSELGLPEEAVLLGTFGRMEKCVTPAYLNAMAAVLAAEPAAVLVLAGRDASGALQAMSEHFTRAGVANRVAYLGRRQADGPRLLKTIDVYCDTYPWPGGQTLLDAMQAGLPIVGMRRSGDRQLDPTGEGSTSALADVLLSGVVELADADDAQAYARIARGYVADRELRRAMGKRLRDKAVGECSMRESTRRYSDLLRQEIDRTARAAESPAAMGSI